MPSISRSFFTSTPSYDSQSNKQLEYLIEAYKLHIHTNSPEPQKFGAKAYTKNGEIYIAPGEENTLKHELAHIYQQKTKNIPATDEIDGQKANTDPKLEKEADEIAENIDSYIPKIMSPGFNGNNVMQFGRRKNKGFRRKMLLNIAHKKGVKKYLGAKSIKTILDKINSISIFSRELTIVIDQELDKIKNIFENEDYLGDNKSLEDAWDELITENTQRIKVKRCIAQLIECCDNEGVISVLKGANTNVSKYYLPMLNFEEDDPESQKRFTDYFVKRLVFMTNYVKTVYDRFRGKYWIRSTGSDPHKDAQHTLFLVNKETSQIECVYKPHDLTADAAVLDKKDSMFVQVNKLIREPFTEKCKELGLDIGENTDALATMDIKIGEHTEELIKKKDEMTPDEAKVYFFRAGILKAITDAMAIIDLHADNIMPTEQGPMIIDAEIDFFHYGDHSTFATGPGNALSATNFGEYIFNSVFTICTEEGGRIESGDAFKSNEMPYYDMYKEGYNFMVKQMKLKKNKKTFGHKFEKQLKRVNMVRLLPIGTEQFAEYLHAAIGNGEKIKVADNLIGKIKEGLCSENSNFLNSKVTKVELDDEILNFALLTTLENGTIPAMYADMEGYIYLDNIIVGSIVAKEGKKASAINIGKKQLIEIIKGCFFETIHKFKPI